MQEKERREVKTERGRKENKIRGDRQSGDKVGLTGGKAELELDLEERTFVPHLG